METRTITRWPIFELFLFLQVLDVMTTLTALRLGGQELNPFIQRMMTLAGSVEGLLLCKLLVIAMAVVVLWRGRQRVVVTVNYLFAFLVVWNLFQLLKVPPQGM